MISPSPESGPRWIWFFFFFEESLSPGWIARSLPAFLPALYLHMGGWLACFLKPKVIQSRDVPPKQVETRVQRVKRPSKSEDFWSSTTFDMDHSAVHSQGSMSSISTSQTLSAHVGTSSGGTPEFVNHGLLLWNQNRQQWIGNKKDENRPKQVLEPRLRLVLHGFHCVLLPEKGLPC